jgi:leucyl/phenylalanyl-tRNA--protein transferase
MSQRDALTPELIVRAYSVGAFPMAAGPRGPIHWYSPDPRAILPLDPPQAFHIPHGLRRRIKKNPYTLTLDQAFGAVIRACAQPRHYEPSTWINAEIIRAYTELHGLGLAHSVEAWVEGSDEATKLTSDEGVEKRSGQATKGPSGQAVKGSPLKPAARSLKPVLCGGLYGVALGGAFFGESMFSRVTDASKLCLVRLVEHLRSRGYVLLDAQIANPHIRQFGVVEIPRVEYLSRLEQALALAVRW